MVSNTDAGPGGPRGNPHLANEAVLVHRATFLAIRQPRRLCPHLLNVLEDHVAVPVEGLDAGEELSVVAHGDEDLGVRAHRRLENREGTGSELVLLELSNLVLAVSKGLWSASTAFLLQDSQLWQSHARVWNGKIEYCAVSGCVGVSYLRSARGFVKRSL